MAMSWQWTAYTAQLYEQNTRPLPYTFIIFLAISSAQNYTALWHQHVCEQLVQGCYMAVHQAGVQPTTYRFWVWHASHYTAKPLLLPYSCYWINRKLECILLNILRCILWHSWAVSCLLYGKMWCAFVGSDRSTIVRAKLPFTGCCGWWWRNWRSWTA